MSQYIITYLGNSVTEGGATPVSGYTVVNAEPMEQALEIAAACPFLDIGASLEVSELIQMSM